MHFMNVGGRSAFLVGDEVFDLEEASRGAVPADPMTVIEHHWDDAQRVASRGATRGAAHVSEVDLRSPVPRPPLILGLANNYEDSSSPHHPPFGAFPSVFCKSPMSVAGPGDDVVLPSASATAAGRALTIFEAELAVVIGRTARFVTVDEAGGYIAGVTAAQDITERYTQVLTGHFSIAKSFDTFCPLGPALVTLDAVGPRSVLRLTCEVNGEPRQDASTGDLHFSIHEIVAYLSGTMTLLPGTVILTGTPAGWGPLRDGDVLTTTIDEIGMMRNRCRQARDVAGRPGRTPEPTMRSVERADHGVLVRIPSSWLERDHDLPEGVILWVGDLVNACMAVLWKLPATGRTADEYLQHGRHGYVAGGEVDFESATGALGGRSAAVLRSRSGSALIQRYVVVEGEWLTMLSVRADDPAFGRPEIEQLASLVEFR